MGEIHYAECSGADGGAAGGQIGTNWSIEPVEFVAVPGDWIVKLELWQRADSGVRPYNLFWKSYTC